MSYSSVRILVASFIGTAIEFYDLYIYATAVALVIGPIFFPPSDPAAQTLQAFATFAIAFVARPFGAMLFGHLGDRKGRKATLVSSLMIMGVSTVLIGCLPSYDRIGWFAPVLLCVLRFGQGLGFGGEWGGAALLAVENAPVGKRAMYGVFPQLGAPVGFALANLTFLVLNYVLERDDCEMWGWRLPFIASAILVGVELYIRTNLAETPVFAATRMHTMSVKVPLRAVLGQHIAATLLGAFAMIAAYAVFYLATVFALSYGTTTLGYERQSFLLFECIAALFIAFAIPLSGMAADNFGRRPVLISGLMLTATLGLLLEPMFGSGQDLLVLGFLCLALFSMGWVFGPMDALLPELFPTSVRCTGASVSYNLAGIVGAAGAPAIAHGLSRWGGLESVGLYLIVAAGISLVAVCLMPETRDASL